VFPPVGFLSKKTLWEEFMMTLSGTLLVNGRGTTLQCELGCFVLNDTRLMDKAAGKYKGFFELQKITPHVVFSPQGQLQVTLLATIKGFSLQTVESGGALSSKANKADEERVLPIQQSLSLEEDVEAVVTPVGPLIPVETVTTKTIEAEEDSDVQNDGALAKTVTACSVIAASEDSSPLASDLSWPEVVELDTTLPRDELRQKIMQLQKSGYQFDIVRQAWQRAA
jgi:hypothetical protein